MASSAPNGSSISRTSASCASARPSATRWRMPPESSCGRLSANSSRFTEASSLGTSASGRSTDPAIAHGSSTFAADGEPREQRRLLEHHRARGRRPSTRSRVGGLESGDEVQQRALAAARRPSRQTNSPRCDARSSVMASACTALAAGPKRLGRLLRSRTVVTAPPPARLGPRCGEHLVEQGEVVDPGWAGRPARGARRRRHRPLTPASDEAIGSRVKSRFFQAPAMVSVGQRLGRDRVSMPAFTVSSAAVSVRWRSRSRRQDRAIRSRITSGCSSRNVGRDDEVGGDELPVRPQRRLRRRASCRRPRATSRVAHGSGTHAPGGHPTGTRPGCRRCPAGGSRRRHRRSWSVARPVRFSHARQRDVLGVAELRCRDRLPARSAAD